MRGPRPTLEREIAFWEARGGGEGLVAGLDEAGRGPLAGPVVAAAVVFPPFCKIIRGLRDSKMLSAPKRARLAVQPAHVLVDGLPAPELGCPHEAIVDGDVHCHSIAAASVVAKTVRDYLMELLGRRHPTYGWASNKGYGTPEHLAALAAFGFTWHHRRSFAPVVQLELIAPPVSIPFGTPPAAAYSGYRAPPVPPAAPDPPRTS